MQFEGSLDVLEANLVWGFLATAKAAAAGCCAGLCALAWHRTSSLPMRSDLCLQPLPLLHWVCQLRECIGQLASCDCQHYQLPCQCGNASDILAHDSAR